MTAYSNAINFPIEKLPTAFEQRTYIKEEIILSDASDHSNNEGRHKRNNNFKLRKRNKKKIRKKNGYKNAKICSSAVKNKPIQRNNEDLIIKTNKNFSKLTKIHKDIDMDSKLDLYKFSNKFLSKKNGYPRDIKSPIVVLERLSIKVEQDLFISDKRKFPYKTDYTDNAINNLNANVNLNISVEKSLNEVEKCKINSTSKSKRVTKKYSDNNKMKNIVDHGLLMDSSSPEEIEIQENNQIEKNMNNIVIKSEIDEQINNDTGHNYNLKESNITDNFSDTEFSIDKIKKENNENNLLVNENAMPELIMIKKYVDDAENSCNENINIREYVSKEKQIEKNNDNLLRTNNIYNQMITNDNCDIEDMSETDSANEEDMWNDDLINQNKSISLKEACEQMAIDGNSDLFNIQQNFDHCAINFVDVTLSMKIDNSDDEVVGKGINNSRTAQNESLLNYISQNRNRLTMDLNQNSSEETHVTYCKGSKMKMFMEKCVKCDRIQKRIDDKITSRCVICEADVYYECLICRSHYKYPAGIYNHISLKHTNPVSLTPVKCLRCNLEFKAQRNMREHLRYCKVLPYLQCQFCSVMAKRKNCLRKHIRIKHKNDIKSKDIEKILKNIVDNSKELKDQAMKMAETIYGGYSSKRTEPFPIVKHIKLYCNRCKQTFKKLIGIDQRSCTVCGAQLFMQCAKCDNVYKFRSSMSLHLRSKCVLTDSMALRCNKCDYMTFTRPKLRRHIYRKHTYIDPQDYLSCYKCGKKFKLKEDLQHHKLNCDSMQMCKCKFCDYKTKCRESLTMHIKYYHSLVLKHEEKKFDDVNTKVAAESIISYCTNCNIGSRPIEKFTKCQFCKTPFIYRCKKCNLQTQKYILMRIHVIRTHGEKIYTCPAGCGNSFAYSHDYRQHFRYCSWKSYHQCDRCPFKTKYKSTFIQHRQRSCLGKYNRIHKKIILRSCCKCGKVFKNKARLLHHVKLCGKLMSFLFCDHCSFRTFAKRTLINHIQSRHAARLFRGINAFHCKSCNQVFKNYFVYIRHIEDCRPRVKKRNFI